MDDLTLPTATRATGYISPEERTRRQAAIDYARTSVRLEGFVISEAAEELGQRYVAGELSTAEYSAAIRARHGL